MGFDIYREIQFEGQQEVEMESSELKASKTLK